MFGATSRYRDDGDAGLILVGARYYDPAVGRFITRDTDLSQFAFVYCNGDPVNYLDPSGHFIILLVIAVVFVAVLLSGCGTNTRNYPGENNTRGGPFPTGPPPVRNGSPVDYDPTNPTAPYKDIGDVRDWPGYEEAPDH
jgi:RHS repeat-associated protein